MPQSSIYCFHGVPLSQYAFNTCVKNGRNIIRHDYGIGLQTRLLSFWRKQINANTTRMSQPRHVAANHGNHSLLQSCSKIVGLNYKNRPTFCS